MADLRSCYFCGTGPGGSLESYGVVPSALDPSPEEQRTVVLCPDCRNKLTALLRPVVEATGATPSSEAEGRTDSSLAGGDATPTSGRETSSVTGLSPESIDEREETSPAATGSDETTSASGTESGDESGRPITFDDESTGSGSGLAASSDGTDDDGVRVEPPERGRADPDGSEQSDSEASAQSSPDEGGRPDASTPNAASTEESTDDGLINDTTNDGDPDASSSDDGSDGTSQNGGPPVDPSAQAMLGDDNEAYRKVLRLLQNRDFPVGRAEIEDLAANAYQLDPQACSDAIDAIVQKGMLVEEDGVLQRPAD